MVLLIRNVVVAGTAKALRVALQPCRILATILGLAVALALRATPYPFGIVIHGGAGGMTPDLVDKDAEAAYRKGLEKALAAGYDVLAEGGPSLDAVQAAVTALEECPLFNAGLGAAFNRDGEHELV